MRYGLPWKLCHIYECTSLSHSLAAHMYPHATLTHEHTHTHILTCPLNHGHARSLSPNTFSLVSEMHTIEGVALCVVQVCDLASYSPNEMHLDSCFSDLAPVVLSVLSRSLTKPTFYLVTASLEIELWLSACFSCLAVVGLSVCLCFCPTSHMQRHQAPPQYIA